MSEARGFTLVELMVVIAIISILSTAGIVLFNNAQKNARDGKRRIDIDAIATALEGKKAPGSATYTAIVDSDFASGKLPSDSNNGTASYCLTATTSAGYTGSMMQDPVTWSSTTTTTDIYGNPIGCPTANFSAGWGVVISGLDRFNTATAWKICALMENPPPSWYCKGSSQ